MSFFVNQGGQVDSSLVGCYSVSPARYMIYGRGTAQKLDEVIAKIGTTKAFIITGRSLSTKTPVIKDAEAALGSAHVGTFSKIGQHAPITAIREATELVKKSDADVLVSIGGGSPVDSAKAIAFQIHRETGKWIPSIAVPTTLSVAETTQNAGFTNEEKQKIAVRDPELVPKSISKPSDGESCADRTQLWFTMGILRCTLRSRYGPARECASPHPRSSTQSAENVQVRALDHAVELLYHPLAPEIPTKRLALEAIRDLFTYLPQSRAEPADAEIRQRLFLACYASLFPLMLSGGVGLSHSTGHALGATYDIPHGITSCLTLAPVVALKAKTRPEEAKMIARVVPYIGETSRGSDEEDALVVSRAIAGLVDGLGHASTLTQYGVPPGEEESIASHALVGGKENPDFNNLVEIIHSLY
ncbi:alcohol dehydrogenase IV [Diplocarpon rosae]|nr:alcohol dehydrogenase IV [Diplocarpon rosae]